MSKNLEKTLPKPNLFDRPLGRPLGTMYRLSLCRLSVYLYSMYCG